MRMVCMNLRIFHKSKPSANQRRNMAAINHVISVVIVSSVNKISSSSSSSSPLVNFTAAAVGGG